MYSLVAVSGRMASGKSTLSELLVSKYGYISIEVSQKIDEVTRASLQQDLKTLQTIFDILDIPDMQGLINKCISMALDSLETGCLKKERNKYVKNDQYRKLLQDIGMLVRDYSQDPGVWVHLLLSNVRDLMASGQLLICSGIRLKEEKRILEEIYKFKTIRLDINTEEQQKRLRDKYETVDPRAIEHETEKELDLETFDLRLDNSTLSLVALEKVVVSFLGAYTSSTVLSDVVRLVRARPLGERDDWIRYFMSIAYMISMRSTCGSRRVGALLVDSLDPGKRRIVATGYNGYPSGEKHCIDGGCPRFLSKIRGEVKSGEGFNDADNPCHAYHAEHNVLNQVLSSHAISTGSTLFCTTHPCISCARMLSGAGISKIYYAEGYPDALSSEYLSSRGIEVIKVDI